MRDKSDVLVSVVFGVRGTAGWADAFIREVAAQLDRRCKDYEIVIIHSGGPDGTEEIIRRLQDEFRNVQFYQLVKRLPRDAEIVAGLEQAIGDVVITIDPRYDAPERIGAFLDAYEDGVEIAYGIRRGVDRGILLRTYRLLARGFVKLFRALSGYDVPDEISDYRLVSRRVLNLMLAHPDRYDLFFMIASIYGFRYRTIECPRVGHGRQPERVELRASLRRAIRILLLSSSAPLRWLSGLSLFGAFASGVYSVYVLGVFLYKTNVVEGWVTLSLQVSGLFFLLFSILAVLSEYIARIYKANREGRPYIIQSESSSRVLTRKLELNVTGELPAHGRDVVSRDSANTPPTP